jgi:hypothetical protein
MKVYIFVSTWRGLEEETGVFRHPRDANEYYANFAERHEVPYDEQIEDYNWNGADYFAWLTECELAE